MSDRTQVSESAANGLRKFSETIDQSPVMVGFDGFVDSIIAVVNTRQDAENFQPMDTIEQFGQKIVAAAGQSSNYELVVKLEKLGGNGPIMANALRSMGFPLTYVGALGHPAIHPVFEDMANGSDACHSICEPGYTDALEFDDGKLMLGKITMLNSVNWEHLASVVGVETLAAIVDKCHLLGMVNWTMLPYMNTIFRALIDELLPKSSRKRPDRRVFIDLADPEKRTREDLLGVLQMLKDFEAFAKVTLGLNLKESTQAAEVLGIAITSEPEASIQQTAAAIREVLSIDSVVIHPRAGAAAACKNAEGSVDVAAFKGPFVARPKISTGAGDHFNAGFCLGQLVGLPVEQALCVGTATSGFYVRNAESPTIKQLADFCDQLPDPEG